MSDPAVLVLLADWSGCVLYRALWPITGLRRQTPPYPAYYQHRDKPMTPGRLAEVQALVLCRLRWESRDTAAARRWVEGLHTVGKAIIYEVDDDLFTEDCLYQTAVLNPERKTLAQLEQERQESIAALQLADGVTVPTAALAAVVRRYTDKPVCVVPNAIAWPEFQTTCQSAPRRVPGPTVGWVGGSRPEAEFPVLAEAWRRIARRYPAVRFVVVGHRDPTLLTAMPPERLVLVPWLPINLYPIAYRDIDILCCPLTDAPFNACKSPAKAFEGAAAGAAIVASPLIYGAVLRHGKDGYLATTADEWEAALARLIEDDAHRRQMAARWAKRVQARHSLAVTLGQWPAAWRTLVEAWQRRGQAA